MELINHRPRLKFKASSRHLAGHYECTANNGVGESATASIQVIILRKTSFLQSNCTIYKFDESFFYMESIQIHQKWKLPLLGYIPRWD